MVANFFAEYHKIQNLKIDNGKMARPENKPVYIIDIPDLGSPRNPLAADPPLFRLQFLNPPPPPLATAYVDVYLCECPCTGLVFSRYTVTTAPGPHPQQIQKYRNKPFWRNKAHNCT